jgi:hypothetical protein
MRSESGIAGTIVTGLIVAIVGLLIEYKSGWFQGNATTAPASSFSMPGQSQSQQEGLKTGEMPSHEYEDHLEEDADYPDAPTSTNDVSVVAPVRISPATSSTLDVTGRWSGEWSTQKGYLFTCSMDLQLSDQTVVTGKIDWVFKLSPRIEEQHLIGRSATEFVRGSFDPRTRALMFQGYDKQDPYEVIGLDSYHLALSDDAREIRGKTLTNNANWEGVFVVRRLELH